MKVMWEDLAGGRGSVKWCNYIKISINKGNNLKIKQWNERNETKSPNEDLIFNLKFDSEVHHLQKLL